MELSIRDAKARFAEAAAAREERVVITKHGHPFVELVPARGVSGLDKERTAVVRRELGLDGLVVRMPPEFDNSAFSREVLGLTERDCCWTPTSRCGRRLIRRRCRMRSGG